MDEELLNEARNEAVLHYAIGRAAADSRDPEVMELLLRSRAQRVEDLNDAMEAIRQEKPYLFADEGGRPRFSAETMDKLMSAEEEAVAERYKGNPWYRRK